MADYRIVLCEACGSEGRVLTCDGGPDEVDHGPCPVCEGTGYEVIEVEPIELEDLETWEITTSDAPSTQLPRDSGPVEHR